MFRRLRKAIARFDTKLREGENESPRQSVENPSTSVNPRISTDSAQLSLVHSSVRQGSLCHACQRLLDSDTPVDETRAVGRISPLKCHICAIVQFHLSNDRFYQDWCVKQGRAEVGSQAFIKFSLTHFTTSYSLFIRFMPSEILPRFHIDFRIPGKRTEDLLYHNLPTNILLEEMQSVSDCEVSKNLDCHSTWKLATKWIDQCVEGHKCCNYQSSETWLPTRLLDLGEQQEPNIKVRLISTSQKSMGEIQRYATLSHCWGNAETIALTKESIDEMQNGIHLSDMPKTFYDAVLVARSISARYLWIDKLCIVQDSPDEWRHEAALMQKVYQHSFCNLATLDSTNDTEGFLCDRDPMVTEHFSVKIHNSSLTAKSYIGYDDQKSRHHPLLKRAWCLQERLLAPRTLNFSRRQIMWECRGSTATEMFPEGVPDANYTENFFDLKKRLSNPFHAGREGDNNNGDTHTPMDAWVKIVSEYSDRQLSRPSDKLYALSGLAHAMKSELGQYVAGMWRRYLWVELLWSVNALPGWGSEFRPSTYRAPTWSWASLEGQVWHPHRKWDPDSYKRWSDILDVRVTTIDGDEFSQVTSGFIRIEGRIKPATWQKFEVPEADIDDVWYRGKRMLKFELRIDGQEEGLVSFDEDLGVSPVSCEILLLPMIQELTPRFSGECKKIHGLVICQFDKDSFRRVGTFSVDVTCAETFEQCSKDIITII